MYILQELRKVTTPHLWNVQCYQAPSHYCFLVAACTKEHDNFTVHGRKNVKKNVHSAVALLFAELPRNYEEDGPAQLTCTHLGCSVVIQQMPSIDIRDEKRDKSYAESVEAARGALELTSAPGFSAAAAAASALAFAAAIPAREFFFVFFFRLPPDAVEDPGVAPA